MRSLLFLDVTQRILVVTDVSGQRPMVVPKRRYQNTNLRCARSHKSEDPVDMFRFQTNVLCYICILTFEFEVKIGGAASGSVVKFGIYVSHKFKGLRAV
jgi:hypothetical protein